MTSTGSFREYCEQTSLHGWFYTASSDRKIWRFLWLLIVLTSMGVASVFVYKASEEFRKATVVTTIHSTTEPLSTNTLSTRRPSRLGTSLSRFS